MGLLFLALVPILRNILKKCLKTNFCSLNKVGVCDHQSLYLRFIEIKNDISDET